MKANLRLLIKPALILLSVMICLLIWQIVATAIDVPLILPMPKNVFRKFGSLLIDSDFWKSLGTSFLHIYTGCLVGLVIGFFIGILTCLASPLDTMLSPIFSVIRSTPVACFIVVAWTFVGAGNLPFFISVLMVAPVMMTGTQSGIRATEKPLLEAAKCYRLSPLKTIRTCYLPAMLPHLFTAIVNCIGLAWKAGIAAEVIVQVEGTVGYEIWDAKSWSLDSAGLYAWTLAVILISLALEYLFIAVTKKMRGGRAHA